MYNNYQLEEQQRKNLQQKKEQQQKELEPYISKYSSEATQILENAFSYFAMFGEYESYRQTKCFTLQIEDNSEAEKFFEVLEKINRENGRYMFFLLYKKGGLFRYPKINISTYDTDSFLHGGFF